MISALKYFDGAVPGSKRKAPQSQSDRQEKLKKYEANRPERKFMESWKEGRPWLDINREKDRMTCKICVEHYGLGSNQSTNTNLRGQNKFITGCSNKKLSTIVDHETSKSHLNALEKSKAQANVSAQSVMQSSAGHALRQLKAAERHRLAHLFRNAHAVAKNNRPLSDYTWLCQIDQAKGLDLGQTYLNQKAALVFLFSIAGAEREVTKQLMNDAPFFSVMMDGSTDISGDEQEVLYLRTSCKGKMEERFLTIGTPESTCSKDLYEFCLKSFEENNISLDKLVGLGSDGASNMVGKKGGLAALLRKHVCCEIVNVHCFAHRLELSFRDVLKNNKHYDKLMTLLIGLHYFYIKYYKNKSGLLKTVKALNIKGILPPKMTGTRWLPHLSRGLDSLLTMFPAYEAHLCTLSHTNPKAEGLVKVMLDKNLVCFALFLKDVLHPLMRLSLRLQKPCTTLADGLFWIETTAELLDSMKTSVHNETIAEVLATGKLQNTQLRGNTPTMSYREGILDGFVEAMKSRFMLEDEQSVINATRILNFKNWPKMDTPEFPEYGIQELKAVNNQFETRLEKEQFDMNEALAEWKILKRVIVKRHGSTLHSLSWDQVYDCEFPNCFLLIDLLQTLPATSVSCETTFSQMKLVKTSRRTKLQNSTLNDLLLVKLQAPSIANFQPENAIDVWLGSGLKPRRPTYKRRKVTTNSSCEPVVEGMEGDESDVEDDVEQLHDHDLSEINSLFCQDESDFDNFCGDYQSEEDNLAKLMLYFRE